MPPKKKPRFPFCRTSSNRSTSRAPSSSSRRSGSRRSGSRQSGSRQSETSSRPSQHSASRSSRFTRTPSAGPTSTRAHTRLPTDSNGNVIGSPSEPPIGDGHGADDAALDSLNEVVMAVDLRERGTVGCCYYVAREEKLYFMEDVKCGGVEVVDTCTYTVPSPHKARLNRWSQ
jgi:DNA mismatch repair protein MSH5